ncbi:hypothetical protein EC957_007386 [Mortierella hygrophila]|uniref:Uncharacterized protein n=1 Tax=Mortierella hygrophila TaxID=979708 RepID=A0A9P6EY24_9FUNG|nr:hypothetical protein EC957_007386 [Mortierella hygrophila]
MVQPCPTYYPSVSQKAVSQPAFKHQLKLPPLCGKDASVVEYPKVLEQHHNRPDDFYNVDDMRFKRHG